LLQTISFLRVSGLLGVLLFSDALYRTEYYVLLAHVGTARHSID
jgi:hypothetical protein